MYKGGIRCYFDMRCPIKRHLNVYSQRNIKGCLDALHQPILLLKGVDLKNTFNMKNLKMNLNT